MQYIAKLQNKVCPKNTHERKQLKNNTFISHTDITR